MRDWRRKIGHSQRTVFPEMVGNLFWEHGHRMVATTVGMLTIVLVIYLFRKEPRRWVRRLGLFALFDGDCSRASGGLTVKLMLPLAVSTAHATLAQLFFCTTVALGGFYVKELDQAASNLSKKRARCRFVMFVSRRQRRYFCSSFWALRCDIPPPGTSICRQTCSGPYRRSDRGDVCVGQRGDHDFAATCVASPFWPDRR